MKKTAILYSRVSTDEQNNGYSPADQKERLYKYCEQKNIEVLGFYHDDESGKSFNRPQWLTIMDYLKTNKGSVDFILFIKWDRFSRDATETYITIKALRKLGVEAQAIEQPLDLDIPEQKLMLAWYVVAPEVDNDRRAINVIRGMRRAKKEGRWLGNSPFGYKNARDEKNKPIIVPEGGKNEALIKKAFQQFSTGVYNIEELRRLLSKEGLKLTKNAFAAALRNKTYIGRIFIAKYKIEPAEWVDGIHDALIDEETFYKVQDILSGRKRNMPNKINTFRDELPLRGHLICPKCGRTLTGSGSTGRSGDKFYYYHCVKGCKERMNAIETNAAFTQKLKLLRLNSQEINLFMKNLAKRLKDNSSNNNAQRTKVAIEIEKNKTRLKNAQMLLLDGDISSTEYHEMKLKFEREIMDLTQVQNQFYSAPISHDKIIETCKNVILNLDIAYEQAGTQIKQRIVGSIFPEKFMFVNNRVRTTKVNEVILKLSAAIKASGKNKKGQQTFFELLPCEVGTTGFEPVALNQLS